MEKKQITVVITHYLVPFSPIVKVIKRFDYSDEEGRWEDAKAKALEFVNEQSAAWWVANEGDRCLEQGKAAGPDDSDYDREPYEPLTHLAHGAHIDLWGGEHQFDAILDEESFWRIHNDYYKAEFDDKGMSRPGFLRVAYGEDVSAEIAEVQAFYGGKRH